MLFHERNCPSCGRNYDPVMESCPFCGVKNPDFGKKFSAHALWVPTGYQAALFIIGFIGLQAFAYIAAFIYTTFISDSTLLSMLTECTAYLLTFAALFALLVPSLRKVGKNLGQWSGYLWGLLFGIGIYLFSVFYSSIVQNVFGIGQNNNQNSLVTLIHAYPVASILIFGIVGPCCEELAYRVGLFNLSSRINRVAGFLVTMVVFGLIHFDFAGDMKTELANLPDYMIVGLFFCLMYDFRGLGCSATAHMLNNLISIVMILVTPVSTGA